jgi:hypothetical protein
MYLFTVLVTPSDDGDQWPKHVSRIKFVILNGPMSLDRAAGLATGHGPDDREVGVKFSVGLWGSPSLLSNG